MFAIFYAFLAYLIKAASGNIDEKIGVNTYGLVIWVSNLSLVAGVPRHFDRARSSSDLFIKGLG